MTTLSFKVTEDEARTIRAQARRMRLSLSEFLRRQAKAVPVSEDKVTRRRCPVTGAPIFAGDPALPPLTTDSVREMLSNHP